MWFNHILGEKQQLSCAACVPESAWKKKSWLLKTVSEANTPTALCFKYLVLFTNALPALQFNCYIGHRGLFNFFYSLPTSSLFVASRVFARSRPPAFGLGIAVSFSSYRSRLLRRPNRFDNANKSLVLRWQFLTELMFLPAAP